MKLPEIGEALLERVKKDIEESLRDKIERQSREKFYLYQAKKRREAELHAQQLHEKYENYIETVQHELQKQLEVMTYITFSIISFFIICN